MTGGAADLIPLVDSAVLEDAISHLNAVMRSHGGHVALVTVSDQAVVTVRFEGFCTGCPYRPATLLATVKPELMQVPGVVDVRAEGTEFSHFAAQRFLDLGFGLRAVAREHTTTKGEMGR